MNKDTSTAAIGGLAGAMGTSAAGATEQPCPSEQKNIPLMTVLRNEPSTSASNNQLHIEQPDELLDELEDSDEERPRSDGRRAGRRKIRIEYIGDKSRRHITFSKRKAGIMKKVSTGEALTACCLTTQPNPTLLHLLSLGL